MGDQSPPLPRGTYNFNFDDFDENTNPFETASKVKVLDNDPHIDHFKPSKLLSQSPTTSNNNINDTVNNEQKVVNHVKEPVKTRNKIPRSPIQSPDKTDDQQNMDVQDLSPEQQETSPKSPEQQESSPKPLEQQKSSPKSPEQQESSPKSPEPQETSPKSPEQQESSPKPLEQQEYSPKSLEQQESSPKSEEPVPQEESPKPQSQKKPAIRKGIKKPKFKSKLKPPANFGAQGDDIEIYAPPPPKASNDANGTDSTPSENTTNLSHDNTQDLSTNENTPTVPCDKTADHMADDATHDLPMKNKPLLQEPNEMAQSLEMVHDFGTHEMPCEENEGISPAPEGFSDSVGLDIAGDAQINSVYLAGNAGLEQSAKLGKKREEIKDENVTQDGNDSELMTTQTSKSTPRVPKHPAARVLDGEVEKMEKKQGEDGEELQYYDAYDFPPSLADSSRVHKNGMRDRMDHTDSIVHLVQVLKYSQSDWNKMKQDLELDFQARLLNKEREWSKKLADREKNISHLREETRILQESNDDMKSIVTEFEKTISQLQAETEKTTNESHNSMGDIIKERDQAIDDLQGVEMAFSDLHRRYEKTKAVVEGFKKNEEVLKKCIEDYQTKLKKSEDKLFTIKQQAEEKLEQASVEMDKLRRTTSSDMARLEAAMRKADLQVASLQQSLDHKIKENEELTAICDELIAKVGTE